MKEEIYKLINSVPNLTQKEKEELANSIVAKSFKKGDYLLREGQIAKNCYSVLKGCIRQ